jgi:hypothetical protein
MQCIYLYRCLCLFMPLDHERTTYIAYELQTRLVLYAPTYFGTVLNSCVVCISRLILEVPTRAVSGRSSFTLHVALEYLSAAYDSLLAHTKETYPVKRGSLIGSPEVPHSPFRQCVCQTPVAFRHRRLFAELARSHSAIKLLLCSVRSLS